jgi:hypothetical protein
MKQTWKIGSLILVGLMLVGCPSESERLARMAEQSVHMQAEQNVKSADANKEFAKLQSDLQTERSRLDQQLKTLEDDRRALHRERRSELAWAESLRFLAIIIAAVTPLFLCAYLIWAATRQSSCHESVNELLIRELASPKPRIIRAPNLRAIAHDPDEQNNQSNHNGENPNHVTRSTNQDRSP